MEMRGIAHFFSLADLFLDHVSLSARFLQHEADYSLNCTAQFFITSGQIVRQPPDDVCRAIKNHLEREKDLLSSWCIAPIPHRRAKLPCLLLAFVEKLSQARGFRPCQSIPSSVTFYGRHVAGTDVVYRGISESDLPGNSLPIMFEEKNTYL
jgi:hypothetical protein